MDQTLIERCIASAVKAGSPSDQVEQFLNCGYCPYPWQWKFHAAAREADYEDGPVDIGLGGARGPGKSHAVLSQAALDDCQRVPGLKVLFLRQTGSSAKESFDDLVAKTLRGHIIYWKTKDSLRFENGSRIILGGFKDERDIDKYVGIEYDLIIVEELTQLTEEKYNKLRGSLRTSKSNWRPRMYTSFNPGGRGHAFVKGRYIVPFRENSENITRFVPSTYKDNPALNKEYIIYLEELGGDLGRAWREGDWDLFEGQYFDEFRIAKHVCDPFRIPETWLKFVSIDPSGRSGITSCHWYALDSNGTVYVYREHYGTGMDADQHAKNIAKMSLDEDGIEERYQYGVIDTAAFAKAGYSETMVEIYMRQGVGVNYQLLPSAKERVVGWNVVHQYLRVAPSTPNNPSPQPRLKIFKNCVNMIRTIPMMQYDALHPEDIDSKGEDHACFTKDTLIEFPIGSQMYQKSNGFKDVYEFMGSKVTKDHPYLTQRGFVRLDELRYCDRIVTWKNKLLMELPLEDIQIQRGLSLGGTLYLLGRNYLAIKQNAYIDIYGKKRMERYQKVCVSIIKTTILLITQYLTSNLYQAKSIMRDTMTNLLINGKKIWRLLGSQRSYGTEVKKVLSFIVCWPKKTGRKLKGMTRHVKFVANNIKHRSRIGQNTATIIAKLPHLGKEEVFSTLSSSGFFAANGVVVSNCDELRYFLRTLHENKAPKPMNAIERRIKQLHENSDINSPY